VSVVPQNGQLVVVVSDDGVGGAEVDGGSGLQGLEDRVGALDGSLSVDSPEGHGTSVRATIPLLVPVEADDGWREPTRMLSAEEAAERQHRRVHALRLRTWILGGAAAVIVIVWALTGAPNAWPVWPLLGIALVVALDIWNVLGSPPPQRAEMGDDPRAFRRRRIRAAAGKLAIINVFLIGIWIAAGAGYFWPAWVLLGSAIAICLKAAPWSHAWLERAQGAP